MTTVAERKGAARSLRDGLERGLVDLNPTVARLFSLPSVMANPPIVTDTVGTGGAMPSSTYTHARKFAYNDPIFRYHGGIPVQVGSTGVNANFYRPFTLSAPSPSGYGTSLCVDFEIDAPSFEMITQSNNGRYLMFVDGHPVDTVEAQLTNDALFRARKFDFRTPAWVTATAYLYGQLVVPTVANGHVYQCILPGTSGGSEPSWPTTARAGIADGTALFVEAGTDTQGRAVRRIRFYFNNNCLFGGIFINKTDMAWTSNYPLGPRVCWLGDSYTRAGLGVTSGQNHRGFAFLVSQLLGWHDLIPEGIDGTGFANTASLSGTPLFHQRVNSDVAAFAPKIVVVDGGINDQGKDPAVTQANALSCFQSIKALPTKPKLIVIGPCGTKGTMSTSDLLNQRNGIRTSANGIADLYIETLFANTISDIDFGLFTGLGKIDNQTGLGNADLYISTDGIHPTDAGHFYRAKRIASFIANAIATGVF